MAIIIGSNFLLPAGVFLDERQGHAEDLQALKDWDFVKYNIPEGFEVYCNGSWYTYSPSQSNPETGFFHLRDESLQKKIETDVNSAKEELSSKIDSVKTEIESQQDEDYDNLIGELEDLEGELIKKIEADDKKLDDRITIINSSLTNKITSDIATLSGTVNNLYQRKITTDSVIDLSAENKVSLKLDAAGNILSKTAEGLLSTINLVEIPQPSNSPYEHRYKLVGNGGVQIGETISVPRDQYIKTATYIPAATADDVTTGENVVWGNPYLRFDFILRDNSLKIVYLPLKDLVDIYIPGDGIDISEENKVSLIIDPESSETISVGPRGLLFKDGKYATFSEFDEHSKDEEIHINNSERASWNGKLDVQILTSEDNSPIDGVFTPTGWSLEDAYLKGSNDYDEYF